MREKRFECEPIAQTHSTGTRSVSSSNQTEANGIWPGGVILTPISTVKFSVSDKMIYQDLRMEFRAQHRSTLQGPPPNYASRARK